MKIIAIGGSNSQQSINRQLANFTANLFTNAIVKKVDISKLDVPLYSIDKEADLGIPNEILEFASQIDTCDLIILSLAENNSSFNVGLKNILDWTSRIKDRKTFNNKPMLLMSTSPGLRGGATVLETAKNIFPYSGTTILASFSLPEFYNNFDTEKGITNEKLVEELKIIVNNIIEKLN